MIPPPPGYEVNLVTSTKGASKGNSSHLGHGDLDPYGSNFSLFYFGNLTWCTDKSIDDVLLEGSHETEGITEAKDKAPREQCEAKSSGANHLAIKRTTPTQPPSPTEHQAASELEGPSLMVRT